MCASAIIEYLLSHDYKYVSWHGFLIGFGTIMGVLLLGAIAILLERVMHPRAACAFAAAAFLMLASAGIYLNVCLWVQYRDDLLDATKAVRYSTSGGLKGFALLNLLFGLCFAWESIKRSSKSSF